MSEQRCFDCFHEFEPNEDRFMVLKKLRDRPELPSEENLTAAELTDPAQARMLESMLYDPVAVCVNCQGWYGDHAVQVTADEALGF